MSGGLEKRFPFPEPSRGAGGFWPERAERRGEGRRSGLEERQSVGAARRRESSASLSPEVQAKVGEQMRAYYAGLIEPPPERFVELLRELDERADEGHSG